MSGARHRLALMITSARSTIERGRERAIVAMVIAATLAGCRPSTSTPTASSTSSASSSSSASASRPAATDAAGASTTSQSQRSQPAVTARAPHPPDPAMVAALAGSAYAIVDAASGRTVGEQRPDWIDAPVWPGSIAKIATYTGALASGTLTSETRVVCTRRLRLADGREVDCSHPEIGHALSLTEALAHSCNVFAATIARAMTPAALAQGFARVGLPPPPADADRVGVALGLAGNKVAPRALLGVMRRVASSARTDRGATAGDDARFAPLLEGLRESARAGTARAFGDAGIDALAKTGTALMPNGHALGLVVAAWPSHAPREALVLAMPGGSGAEAAALAAMLVETRTSTQSAAAPAPAAAPADATGIILRIGTPRDTGYLVESVPLEDYVASVVTGESSDATPQAVREALAITARTYALANRHRHADDGFDLCRLTHCQVARPTSSPAARQAAERTRGLILHDARADARQPATSMAITPVQVFYSAACGGRLADASVLLPNSARGSLPWMTERADPAGVAEPSWSTEIRGDDLLRALRSAGLRGDRLRHLAARRDAAGDRDVARILVDGLTPPELRADDFRRIIGQQLGWEKLKSLRFTVARSSSGYRFDGEGHGHGVGLCVFGASALATRGASAEQLLASYFPGLAVAPIRAESEAGVVAPVGETAIDLRLPTEQEGERATLRDIVRSELDRLSKDLGVTTPARVALIVHPTGESYRRATGRAWWTSATTVEERGSVAIHLVPIAALRANGRLRATLRHEIVHVLTMSALRGRPLWVQEGVATHFAIDPRERAQAIEPTGSSRAGNAAPPASCPDDRAFRQARDRMTTERAYRDAASCVARQLATVKSWRDLGVR